MEIKGGKNSWLISSDWKLKLKQNKTKKEIFLYSLEKSEERELEYYIKKG